MENYKSKFDKGIKRGNFNEYNRIVRKAGRATEAHKLKIRKTDPLDTNWRRLYYVRYADDFIIGIIGNKEEAENIKAETSTFLKEKLGLELNLEKTKITH